MENIKEDCTLQEEQQSPVWLQTEKKQLQEACFMLLPFQFFLPYAVFLFDKSRDYILSFLEILFFWIVV